MLFRLVTEAMITGIIIGGSILFFGMMIWFINKGIGELVKMGYTMKWGRRVIREYFG